MKTLNWSNRLWNLQETWGQVHDINYYMWSDYESVSVENNNLVLKTSYKPKFFPEINKTSNWAKGFACCMDNFHFGNYIITAKLPKGKYLWPAIWLYDLETWPPEIDIMEGYSNKRGNYLRFGYPIYNLTSDFHYYENTNKRMGGKIIDIGLKNPHENFITFIMEWSNKKITLFANNKKHRVIEGNMMKHYQRPMRMILSNGVQKNKQKSSEISNFIISNFKYYPK